MTPGQAAKQWAKEHPDFSGWLEVISLTPAGKGGWMTKTKRTKFVVGEGLASLHRYTRLGFNGFCYVCGQVSHELNLRDMYARHPHAGEPAPEVGSTVRGKVVFADYARLGSCCRVCAETLNATPDIKYQWDDYQRGIFYYNPPRHPAATCEALFEHLDISRTEGAA